MLWTYITNTRKSNTRSIEIQKNNTLNIKLFLAVIIKAENRTQKQSG